MTPNTAARNTAAAHFVTDYGSAVLRILDGATVLAEHTLTGFDTPTGGLITANAIDDDDILATGDADGATLTAGTNVLTLTVGTSGAEVNISNLSMVENGVSEVNSLTVQY